MRLRGENASWSHQVRYNPRMLADIAQYFDDQGVHLFTKSMLFAYIIEWVWTSMMQNGLIEPQRTCKTEGEAFEIFSKLGYKLNQNRRSQKRVMKSLQMETLSRPLVGKQDEYREDMSVIDAAEKAKKLVEDIMARRARTDRESLEAQKALGRRPDES